MLSRMSGMKVAPLVAAGLLTLGLGAAADLTYHALDQGTPLFRTSRQLAMHRELESAFGRDGQRAHLVTLAGMVVTVAGVVQRGLGSRSH